MVFKKSKDEITKSKSSNELACCLCKFPNEILSKYIGGDIIIKLEQPILAENGYLIGVADAIAKGDKGTALIEIKSSLYDVSGAIKQLNIYDLKVKSNHRMVFISELEDNELDKAELLKNQGIILLQAKGYLNDHIKCKSYELLMKSKIPSTMHDNIVKQVLESPNIFDRLPVFIGIIEQKIKESVQEKVLGK